jgi:hypothetical protein
MKYKVGDKVRVVANITSNSRKDNYIGKTYTILNKYDGYPAGQAYGIGEDYVVYGEELELIPKHQSIHIYTDGITTTAILRKGKRTVRTASAICHPSDEFDFKTGASLSFDRVLGRTPYDDLLSEIERLKAEIEQLQPKPEQTKYYNGKVVCVATNGGSWHKVGKIYECKDGYLEAERPAGAYNSYPYESLAELQLHSLPTFLELVED